MKKICFVSSSGGHYAELMCLKEIAENNDSFYVTEMGGQVEESSHKNLYLLPQINRHEKSFIPHFINLFGKAIKIIKKEKPDVVITTGALLAFPFCLVAKIFGKKVIYIESFARVYEKSLTGKLVYPFADLFIVQWETMLKCYPKAKYTGGIF
ncbi:MAG: PssD/Cps14F family polysaccharide biosynthesis glycosyltransferase [Acutalibacteraceae bacterium]|nr:PssD/Cps14F family polysaccharide biosynthesis glycosyltransferase [Acutalibacteraceae bacterium]